MKIIFLGTPSFVDPVLEELKKNFEVVASIRSPQELNRKKLEQIKELNPDFFVVAAFGKILSKEILDIPKFGVLNVHPSLLPKYRGPTPGQTAILDGEEKSGVTIIELDEGVDHGPILGFEELTINPGDTTLSFYQKAFEKGAQMLSAIIKNYANNKFQPIEQNHENATFTKSFTRDDGFVDLQNPPTKEKIELMIRAFYPWPGVWTKWEGKIIKLLPDKKIQIEGKKPIFFRDFENGYPQGKELLRKLNLN